jgi:HAD superfamily hydrolase (TIGR01509 family)
MSMADTNAVAFRPILAVICDLDGTLVDTEGAYRTAFTFALEEFGAALSDSNYSRLIGLPTPARKAMLLAMLGPCFPIKDFLAAYYRHREALLSQGVTAKSGVSALLAELDRQGLPRAVATSASTATARRHLDQLGLARHFDAVVTREHVARGKPAPDTFLRAAALLGVAAQNCLAIEDSAPGAQAASACGMMVVVVPDRGALAYPIPGASLRVLPSLGHAATLLAQSAMKPMRRNVRSPLRV